MLPILSLVVHRLPGEPPAADPSEERFLAFGRVFSGVLRAGAAVHVLPSTYDPTTPGSTKQEAVASALYLMMGRGLDRLQASPARNRSWVAAQLPNIAICVSSDKRTICAFSSSLFSDACAASDKLFIIPPFPSLQEVPAGNILAIAGLELSVLKCATLSSSPACRPLAPMLFQSAPIVRVAVEPALPAQVECKIIIAQPRTRP